MMTVVGVVSSCGLKNEVHSRNQPNKTKVALYIYFKTH